MGKPLKVILRYLRDQDTSKYVKELTDYFETVFLYPVEDLLALLFPTDTEQHSKEAYEHIHIGTVLHLIDPTTKAIVDFDVTDISIDIEFALSYISIQVSVADTTDLSPDAFKDYLWEYWKKWNDTEKWLQS